MIYNLDGTKANPNWTPSHEFVHFMAKHYPDIKSDLIKDAKFGNAGFVHGHALYYLFARTMRVYNLSFNEIIPFIADPDNSTSYGIEASLRLVSERFKVRLDDMPESMLHSLSETRNMQTVNYIVWMNGVHKFDMNFLWNVAIKLRDPENPVDYPDVNSLRKAVTAVAGAGEVLSVSNLTVALTKAI